MRNSSLNVTNVSKRRIDRLGQGNLRFVNFCCTEWIIIAFVSRAGTVVRISTVSVRSETHRDRTFDCSSVLSPSIPAYASLAIS